MPSCVNVKSNHSVENCMKVKFIEQISMEGTLWNHFNLWGYCLWVAKILLVHGDVISWFTCQIPDEETFIELKRKKKHVLWLSFFLHHLHVDIEV
jgi:hypothetical protein